MLFLCLEPIFDKPSNLYVLLGSAIISFIRFGKIDLTHLSGKIYLYTPIVTFTRVPLGHLLAKTSTDPLIAQTLLMLLIAFVAGAIYQ